MKKIFTISYRNLDKQNKEIFRLRNNNLGLNLNTFAHKVNASTSKQKLARAIIKCEIGLFLKYCSNMEIKKDTRFIRVYRTFHYINCTTQERTQDCG